MIEDDGNEHFRHNQRQNLWSAACFPPKKMPPAQAPMPLAQTRCDLISSLLPWMFGLTRRSIVHPPQPREEERGASPSAAFGGGLLQRAAAKGHTQEGRLTQRPQLDVVRLSQARHGSRMAARATHTSFLQRLAAQLRVCASRDRWGAVIALGASAAMYTCTPPTYERLASIFMSCTPRPLHTAGQDAPGEPAAGLPFAGRR